MDNGAGIRPERCPESAYGDRPRGCRTAAAASVVVASAVRLAIISAVGTLVHQEHGADREVEALRVRLAELESLLIERLAEAERVKAGLESFRVRYRQEVGLLHDQLDKLELAIAEAEVGELAKKLEDAGAQADAPRPETTTTSQPRFTSDAVRKLFREVAKIIHPDRALDQHARDRRHALMIEANRAYALGDEEQLRGILAAWESSPEAVTGSDAASTKLRLTRRAAQIESQLEAVATEVAELEGTPLWELKAMVDEAAIRGKDIVADMVRRLKRDIMAASNRLDAMRHHS